MSVCVAVLCCTMLWCGLLTAPLDGPQVSSLPDGPKASGTPGRPAVAAPAGSETRAEHAPRRIASGLLQIGVDPRTGQLCELTDLAAKHNHVDPPDQAGGLWELRLRRGSEALALGPDRAKSFRVEEMAPGKTGLRLIWGQFDFPAAPELRVEATVQLDLKEPISRWGLVVDKMRGLSLLEIRFPRIAGIARQENERLAVPIWMGQELTNPRRLLAGPQGKGRRLAWHYPGPLSLQCLAYYRQDGPGLYAACDDVAAMRKGFAIEGDGQGRVGFEALHCPALGGMPTALGGMPTALGGMPTPCVGMAPNAHGRPSAAMAPQGEATDRYDLGYRVLLGTFQGDWFTAAERYRQWGLRQDWARESRLLRGRVPDWVLGTGAWVWNRGRSPQVLPPAMAFQERLGLPVAVFWHWWHGCAYDAGFPEYLPPREGSEPFRAALAQAHDRGVKALVYMNQRLWGTTTKSWRDEQAERWAVRGRDGEVLREVYNIFTRQPCAPMCIGTPFWRNKYAGLAEQAFRELGVDGIYMDQACLTLPCYDPGHGHAPGGGNFWTEGFRQLADALRRRCDAPRPIVLAGEGCGETWLPWLDLMLSLQVSKERYAGPEEGWEVIPLFHAVYHPCAVLYGNYSSLTVPPYDDLWPAEFAPKEPLALLDRRYSQQFRLEQARAFVWGQQPTIANFLPPHLDERREEIDYVMRLARTRSRALEYLLHGTMLRAPPLDVPEVAVSCSRLSIYAGQKDRLRAFQKSFPAALAAAWRAQDGRVAVVLASIVERELRLPLRLDATQYGLPQRGRVEWIDHQGRRALGRFGVPGPSVEVRLPPCGACVIEFAAESGSGG